MKITKNILTTTCFLFLASLLSAASFSGYTGIRGDLVSKAESESFDPALNLQGYFGSQINITPHFSVRGEINLKTADVIETKLVKDTDSVFKINELSALWTVPFLGAVHNLSLFTGNFENSGTNSFLKRNFGISPVTSRMTETWLGQDCVAPALIYGTGGAYSFYIDRIPLAAGLYIYKNENNPDELKQINIDLRCAAVKSWFTTEATAGIAAPLESKNGSEDVILLVDHIFVHTNLSFLLGNKYSTSLFVQAGFDNISVNAGESKSEIMSDEIYILFEPRLYTQKFQAHLTAFSLPKDTVNKLVFIEENNTLGLNLNIFTDRLFVTNRDCTFGFNTTLSFADKDFFALKDVLALKDAEYVIKVSPYTSIPVMGGDFNMMLQVKISGFAKDSWQNQLKVNLGYKTVLN